MKVQVSRPLSGLSIVAAIAFAAFAASAQTTPMMGGEMKGVRGPYQPYHTERHFY